MSDPAQSRRPPRARARFPLASLALLVTALASALACIDLARWHEQSAWLAAGWPWRPVLLFGGAGLVGAMFGLPYLFDSRLSWRSRLVAPAAGVLAGAVGLLVLMAPGPIWRTILVVGVLLAMVTVFRLGAE